MFGLWRYGKNGPISSDITVDTAYYCLLNRTSVTLIAQVITCVALTLRREHTEVSVATFVTFPVVVGVHFIASLKQDLRTAETQQAVITLTHMHKTQPNVFSTLIFLVPEHCELKNRQIRTPAHFHIQHYIRLTYLLTYCMEQSPS